MSSRSEKSAEAVLVRSQRRRAEREGVIRRHAMRWAPRQMSASAERSGERQGEALSDPVSDEARRPRHETEEHRANLNFLNCPVRTRMPGGVGGEGLQGPPYPDRKLRFLPTPDCCLGTAEVSTLIRTRKIEGANEGAEVLPKGVFQ